MGNIGREVARLASAFGCEVRYYSTSGVKREEQYTAMDLEELLKWSDIVSVHSPLNERTRGLIGRNELQLMKPSALIINVARGGIIEEAALAEALDNGWIAAAALDVFSVEPLRESPLYNIKDKYRLLASPHNAWSAAEAIDRLIECVAENIRVWLAK
jgi:glycerate dehydrogenase